MNILEVRNLNKTYKDFQLKDVNLTIPKGYIMGFVGQNGAGKTSTINLINHICKCDSGSIKIDGISYADDPVRYKESIAYVGDECYFTKGLKVKNVKQTLKEFYPTFDSEKFDSLIEKYNLPINKNIINFSRGMKVKLMFATVFSRDAKSLILDEATSGLDPIMRDEMLDVFLEFVQEENHSILLSSHITSDLEKVADYITFIHNGKLIMTVSKNDLVYNYAVMRCKESQFLTLDPKDILAYRKRDFQIDVLVSNGKEAQKKYKGVVVDHVSVDEIMLLLVKGERV